MWLVSQLRHSLVVHPLLKKILDPPLKTRRKSTDQIDNLLPPSSIFFIVRNPLLVL